MNGNQKKRIGTVLKWLFALLTFLSINCNQQGGQSYYVNVSFHGTEPVAYEPVKYIAKSIWSNGDAIDTVTLSSPKAFHITIDEGYLDVVREEGGVVERKTSVETHDNADNIDLPDFSLWTITAWREKTVCDSSIGTVTVSPKRNLYTAKDTILLTATPVKGAHFVSWNHNPKDTLKTKSFTLSANRIDTAIFVKDKYALHLTVDSGVINASPSKAQYYYGDTVTLTAVPNSGFIFTGWNGNLSDSINPKVIIMDGDKTVSTSFKGLSARLKVQFTGTPPLSGSDVTYQTIINSQGKSDSAVVPGAAASTFFSSGITRDSLPAGLQVSGTIRRLEGSVVEREISFSKVTTPGENLITLDFGSWVIKAWRLGILYDSTKGSVTVSPSNTLFPAGDTVTLTASPLSQYNFNGWSGGATGTTNPVKVVIDTNKSISAGFAIKTYTLTTAAPHGSITVSPVKASYNHGDTVILTVVPDTGYNFATWSGDAAGTANPVTLIMNANKSVTAGFALKTYTLTTYSAHGTITISPQKATYSHGDTVTLTAVPDTGHNFGTWSGDAAGTVNPFTLVMNGNKSVTAGFAIKTYTLATAATHGSITVSPVKDYYNHGDTITLTAVPETGYNFTNWSGDLTGGSNQIKLVMNGNKSVTAGFANETYTLATAAAHGTISVSPAKAHYLYGDTVTLTVVPDTGYNFTTWSGDAAGITNPVTLVMNGNKSVTAGFAIKSYTLATAATHGSITVSPVKDSYNHGDTVTLTAVPETGYTFTNWNGDLTGETNQIKLVMNANKSVTAVFANETYTLATAAAHGTISVSPAKAHYLYGDTVILTVVPDTGYIFTSWSGDAAGITNPVTLVMNGNKSVTAAFAIKNYTLSTAAAHGTITVSPQKTTYTHGDSVTLTVVPDTGYNFTGWSGGLSGTTNPITLVMDGNKSVTAEFAIKTYTLATTATHGTITLSPQKTTYNHGDTVILTVTPNTGYNFTGWSGDAAGTTNPVTLVMNSNKSVTASFTTKTFALSITAAHGSVTASPQKSIYNYGDTVTLTAEADSEYTFKVWSGSVSGVSNPLVIVIDTAKSLTATFEQKTYTLTLSGSNCTITANPSKAQYVKGDTVALKAVASDGYRFSRWEGSTTANTDTVTVIISGNMTISAIMKQIDMALIPGGTFTMGSSGIDPSEEPAHTVTISAFYMDRTEVTQEDYNSIMGNNPSSFVDDTKPVESVSWTDAVLYCNARSKIDGLDTVYSYTGITYGSGTATLDNITMDMSKNGYRLPTEAEWEYACRGGTTTTYYWGNDTSFATVDKYAVYGLNSNQLGFGNPDYGTHPVAGKIANSYGLHDMIGNVYEWCNDWMGSYGALAVTDPIGPGSGTEHVVRGGDWVVSGPFLGCASRRSNDLSYKYNDTGFRVVRRK